MTLKFRYTEAFLFKDLIDMILRVEMAQRGRGFYMLGRGGGGGGGGGGRGGGTGGNGAYGMS